MNQVDLSQFLTASAALVERHYSDTAYILSALAGCALAGDTRNLRVVVQQWVKDDLAKYS